MDALVAEQLTKRYRSRRRRDTLALDRVDLTIPKGMLFGFLGRNGAGKTTLIKIASTLLAPTSGRVLLFDRDVMKEAEAVRPLIALVPQEGKPFFHLTAREHVEEYLRVRGASAEAARSRADEVLHAMGLDPYADEVSYRLSGGLQQRTLVAMILATQAPFLFLDEPTLGMDPFARRQVWEVIRDAARHGSTILLTTHYLDEAEQLSEQLAIIEGGHILYRGVVRDLKARLGHEVRVELSGNVHPTELEGFGPVHPTAGGLSVLTTQRRVPELTDLALARGVVAQVGPVSLEEAFLELVGRRIEEDEE